MSDKRLQSLLKRYQNNRCTEDEINHLNDWFHSLNYGNKNFEAWVKEAGTEEILADELYKNFLVKANHKHKAILFKPAYRIAAAILILISIGVVFYRTNKNKETPKLSSAKPIQKEIVPGSNKAILTLANGSKIILDNTQNGEVANQAGVSISKTTDGKLVYKFSESDNIVSTEDLAYNVLETPRAGQYQAILPDGTKIWLNADSRLRFPVKFSKEERNVELTGEAYFEVAKDKSRPFKVSANGTEVKVLGTHFNINAYHDELSTNTTLLEGSVLISNLSSRQVKLLKPGQQSNVFKNSGYIDVSPAKVDEATAWINGYFVFDNQDIKSIMKVISRWYDVDVEYQDISNLERFGGTFSRSSDLSEILKNMELVGKNIHFKVKGRRIIVSN